MGHRLTDRKGREITYKRGMEMVRDGRAEEAAMFSVDKEWHGLGKRVDGMQTAAQALHHIGADFEVKLDKVFTADMKEIEGFNRTYRTDTNQTLGIVGDRYHVIDTADALDLMDSVIGEPNGPHYESGGLIGNGERIFLSAAIDPVTIAKDLYECRFVLTTTHDGSGACDLLMSPVRPVCQNTVNAAISTAKRSYKIRHTRNYEKKLADARKALGFVHGYYEQFVIVAERMLKQKFTEAQFSDLIDSLLVKPDTDASKRTLTMYERNRDKLMSAYAADDIDNIRGTKWGAYNAVVDYHDHLRDRRGDEQRRKENEFLSAIERTSFKDQAFTLLTATA